MTLMGFQWFSQILDAMVNNFPSTQKVDSPINSALRHSTRSYKLQTHCFHVERQGEAFASDTPIHVVALPCQN